MPWPATGCRWRFLGNRYPDGTRAAKTDCISDPSNRYADQARVLHEDKGYANRLYGHVVSDGDADVWLQYWFFYFFNDYNLIGPFIHAGLHEGDWEMIQIHLTDEQPDQAVYAQHWSPRDATGDRLTSSPRRSGRSSTSPAARTRPTSSRARSGPATGSTMPTASAAARS